MGLFFNRNKKRQPMAEPESQQPVQEQEQQETYFGYTMEELAQAAINNGPMPENWTGPNDVIERHVTDDGMVVEVNHGDPRALWTPDAPRLDEMEDGTACVAVRNTIYHQDEISVIDGESVHLKPKLTVYKGIRYYELLTDTKMCIGYVSQLTLDRYMIATRGGIDARVVRPESERGSYDVMIPVSAAGVENAERLEKLDVTFRLDEKWWCADRVEDRESFGSCVVLERADGSAKPQLYVACGSQILLTANSRMKAYPLLSERSAEVIRMVDVRATESEYGTVYIVDLRY